MYGKTSPEEGVGRTFQLDESVLRAQNPFFYFWGIFFLFFFDTSAKSDKSVAQTYVSC